VVRAHCRRNRRRARPELVYRLVPLQVAARERARARAREVIVELLQRLTELSPCDAEVLMTRGVGSLVVVR
jgi:hypothetical protein